MNKPKFNKGEWCFCEFELSQIVKTQENRITERTDGFFNHSSHDLSDRCFPLEMPIKRISDSVAYWSKTFHGLKFNGLNHPDLNRALISRWVEMCNASDDEEQLKILFKKLDEFGQEIQRKVSDLKHEQVAGVKIFSR